MLEKLDARDYQSSFQIRGGMFSFRIPVRPGGHWSKGQGECIAPITGCGGQFHLVLEGAVGWEVPRPAGEGAGLRNEAGAR